MIFDPEPSLVKEKEQEMENRYRITSHVFPITDRFARKRSQISCLHRSSRHPNENLTKRLQVKVKERKTKNRSFSTLSFLPSNFFAKGLKATAFTVARITQNKIVHRGHWPKSRSRKKILLSYNVFTSLFARKRIRISCIYRSSRHPK